MGVSVRVNLDDALDNLLKTSEMDSVQKVGPRDRKADWLPGVTWSGDGAGRCMVYWSVLCNELH